MTNKYDNNQYTAVYLLQLLFRNQTIKEISMLSLETYRNRHLGMANESARQTACVCLHCRHTQDKRLTTAGRKPVLTYSTNQLTQAGVI